KAEETLGTYGVLTDDDWVEALDRTYLTASQKQQIRETAYFVLIYLADYRMRVFYTAEDSAEKSLKLLHHAERFHEPTRAFYWVRSQCGWRKGTNQSAEEDVKRYKQMEGRTAWDYFMPGQTAAWNDDVEEAMRSFEAALRVQPNHFNSLF